MQCSEEVAANSHASASFGYVTLLQAVTIGWMFVECCGSLLAAAKARSLPMATFGADSFVELLSAGVVLLQFGKHIRIRPATVAQIVSYLLFLLGVVVAVLAVLATRWRIVPERSYLGIRITLGALVIMPTLTVLKRHHAHTIQDRALATDAVQSATCTYLEAITLVSLLLQAVHPL